MGAFPEAMAHGPLSRVCDGVWCVRGAFRMGRGLTVGRTMTVVEADDGLVVLNAIRLSEAGHAELDGVGRVTHLVKLSDSHGVDEPFYVDRYAPTYWTLSEAHLPRGLEAGRTFGPEGPVPGGVVFDFAGTHRWREATYLVPHGGGTLIACDALQNWVDGKHASLLGRIAAPLGGFRGGVIVAARWRRLQHVAGADVRRLFAPVTEQTFANLVTGHGPPVVGGADARVRAAVERVSG